MSDEKIRGEVEQAAGNNLIEGNIVTDAEKKLVLHILQKYDGADNEAINALLAGIQLHSQDGEEENVKRKK